MALHTDPGRSVAPAARTHNATTMSMIFKYWTFLIVFLAAAATTMQQSTFPPYTNQEAVSGLAASQNNFTRDMYMKLAEKSKGNLFFSPFSIMAALGMTYGGARGNTEQEMRTVMHLSEDKDLIHDAFQDIVTDMKTPVEEYELRTSNMIYVSHKQTVLCEFNELLENKYLSTSKTVDFGASEEVRQEINAAVEKETNSRIKDLIPSGVLNSLTRMVLVNAIYFKGLWAKQFREEMTRDRKFWTSETESVNVPMMHNEDKFRMFHFQDLEATALAMDYKGSRLSMVIVLPDKRDGLKALEAKMATMDLNDINKKLVREVKVEVVIPKFKLEDTLDLGDTLQEMGIKDLFDGGADLSGISGSKDLYVSKVIHKAFLEVNEQGSEAAAATGVVMVLMSARLRREPLQFIADHPFVFFIQDYRSRHILFSGRLVTP